MRARAKDCKRLQKTAKDRQGLAAPPPPKVDAHQSGGREYAASPCTYWPLSTLGTEGGNDIRIGVDPGRTDEIEAIGNSGKDGIE